MKKIISMILAFAAMANMITVTTVYAGAASDKQKEAVMALGFLESVREEVYLSRENYAKAMLFAFGYENAYDDMEAAAALQLIGLFDEGGYAPESYATFGETVRGLVTLLGYDAEVKNSQKTAQEFLNKGRSLGITAGVNKKFDSPVTEAEFARMLYNCFDIPVMMTKFDGSSVYIGEYDMDFLEKRHDIHYKKGTVYANEYTTLSSPSGVGKGNVQIDNEIYNAGKSGAEELLGYSIEFYYRDDDGEDTVIWAYADPKKNNELFLTDDMITDFSGGVCTWEDNTRERRAKTAPDAAYIYNLTAAKLSDIPSLTPYNGDITFIDNNNDGRYDVVCIMDYDAAVVSDHNRLDGIIYAEGDISFKLILEDYDSVTVYSSDFEKIAPDTIKEKDTLWIAENKERNVLTVLVSQKTVTGSVSSVSEDTKGRMSIGIGGEEYGFSVKNIAVKNGDSGIFYIDIAGRIAGMEKTRTDELIGWLLSAYISDEDELLYIKMFDGKVHSIPCSDKLNFNGTKKSDKEDVIEILKDGAEKIPGQIVRYKQNAEEEITFLQTATDTFEERNRLFVEGVIPKQGAGVGVLYKRNMGNLLTNSFALEDDATVFIIPSDPDNYQKYVKGGPELIPNDATVYGITGYKLDPDDDRCAAAVYDKTVSGGGDPVGIVPSVIKSISNALLPNDEEGYQVNYYSISTRPATITEGAAYIDDEELIKDINSGDLVRMDIDEDGMISAIQHIYSAGEKKFINRISGAQWGAQFRGNGGPVTQKYKNSVRFSVESSYAAYMTSEMLLLDYCAVYVCKKGNHGARELYIGTKSDIAVGDEIVYTSRVGQDIRVVVYK